MPLGNAGLISACLDQLYPVKSDFSNRFYRNFFRKVPWAEALFIHDPKKQEVMLFAVMSMVARGFDSGRDMKDELNQFGRGHARLGVREEMFPVFGAVFLETLIEFLPDWDHPQLARAWWGTFTELSEQVIAGMREERELRLVHSRLFTRERGQQAAAQPVD